MFLTGTASVTEALTTSLSTIASDMLGAVSSILPIAAPVVGGVLVITFGIKVFKKFAK